MATQVKVRTGFNVSIPPKDPKKNSRNLEEGETAFLSDEELALVGHQVEIIQPKAK